MFVFAVGAVQDGLPPVLMTAVPVDGAVQPLFHLVFRFPVQAVAELGVVKRIALVVAGTVFNKGIEM